MISILVVEDDRELSELFCTFLSDNDYNTYTAYDGLQAFSVLEDNHIDLIITDVMMPNMDGFEMTKFLHDTNQTIPVLMITAKDSILDKKEGFLSGADDYMVKPINMNEMIWRVEALLRRSQIVNLNKTKIGDSEFNRDNLTVTFNNKSVELVQKEFMLLFKLACSPNKIFTRIQIMNEIWGIDTTSSSHTLDVHISRLREKFKDNPDFEIVTLRGLGYKLVSKKNE